MIITMLFSVVFCEVSIDWLVYVISRMAATKIFVGMLKRKRESYNLMKMSVGKGKKEEK